MRSGQKPLAAFLFVTVLTVAIGSICLSASAADKPVTLNMWSWRTEDANAWNEVIAEFEKSNPNIQVKFHPYKNTEYDTILGTALQSGTGPDIYQLRPYNDTLINAGYAMALDGLVPELASFPKTALNGARSSRDGKVYGVSYALNTTQIYYNKTIFAKYGMKEPRTWDEFISVCKTLASKGVTPLAQGTKDGWTLSIAHSVFGPNIYGGNDFTNQFLNGKTQLTNPKYVASIERMLELAPYFMKNYTGVPYTDTQTMFAMEQAAMFVGGSWEYGYFISLNPNIKIGVFPAPTDDGSPGLVSTWASGIYAGNPKTKHFPEVITFLRFVSSTKFGQMMTEKLRIISPIRGVKISDPVVKEEYRLAQEQSTPNFTNVYLNHGSPSGKKVLEDNLQGMYLGKVSPQKVAQNVDKAIEGWFVPYQGKR